MIHPPESLLAQCIAAGVHEYGIIPISAVQFSDEVRHMCEQNLCGHYGKSWSCPPAVGPVADCRAACLRYEQVYVFSTLHQLEDSFDFEGIQRAQKLHGEIGNRIRQLFAAQFDPILALASDGCTICAQCTYPDAPCRFPDYMTPSVESYGIFVTQEAAAAGMHYMNGPNTVTFFGNIFF